MSQSSAAYVEGAVDYSTKIPNNVGLVSAVARRAKAEATKQSILSLLSEMDCFAYARSDGLQDSCASAV